MKNLLLTLITLVICSQVSAQSKLRFGATAKPLVSFLKVRQNTEVSPADIAETRFQNINSIENDGVAIGFAYGVQGEYMFGDNYSFEVNFLHVMKRGKFNLQYDDYQEGNDLITNRTENYNLRLQYLQLPFILNMRTNEIGYMTYFARFGFSPSFALTGKVTEKFNYEENGVSTSVTREDLTYNANLINTLIIIGAGAQYSLGGTTALVGGVTFHNGLSPIDGKTAYNLKTSYVLLNLGILF